LRHARLYTERRLADSEETRAQESRAMTVTSLQEANRRKLIAAFEAPGNQTRQYIGGYNSPDGTRLCAIALRFEMFQDWESVGEEQSYLVPWNDDEKLTFAQIGARLRERWGIPM
jgi:hypothetical protein